MFIKQANFFKRKVYEEGRCRERKTESIRKLSNFNFQWTITLYQNNLKNIAFFFYIFQGLKM